MTDAPDEQPQVLPITEDERRALDEGLEQDAFHLTAAAMKQIPGSVPNNEISLLVTIFGSMAISLKRLADVAEAATGDE